MDIKFMTAHASKGLQRDFVFLLCCSGGLKGFPSAIPEEPLLGLLLPEVERMPHAEERRLFYVAMTRCKRSCFSWWTSRVRRVSCTNCTTGSVRTSSVA